MFVFFFLSFFLVNFKAEVSTTAEAIATGEDSENPLDGSTHSAKSDSAAQRGIDDVSRTWYPPLKNTLALLSKLYGVVEMSVFEDFARRGVLLCVNALRSGADKVKRKGSPLHGDLFLVRHLLILREQLIPFEIRLNTVERQLDWSGTRSWTLLFSPYVVY